MSYEILTTEKLPAFLERIGSVEAYFGGAPLRVEEIGDGNLNFVYRVVSETDPSRSLIVKQAVPYLRIAGEGFPLSRERMTFEIRALKTAGELAPGRVPKLYHADEAMSVAVMEDLREHVILRKGLIESVRYERFAEQIGDYLARTLFYTSSLALQSDEKRRLVDRFNANTELCRLTEDFVFTFPYMENETNEIDPQCRAEAKTLFSDTEFKREVLKLKYLFMTRTDALLHGDLHTGSIMATPEDTRVIDPEFAFVGPFGFDVGALAANLISAWISHTVRHGDPEYRAWLLRTLREVLEGFETKFLALWRAQEDSALVTPGFLDAASLEAYREAFMRELFSHTLGFAGCKMSRRVFGIAGVEEIRGIEDDALRKEAMSAALRIGRALVMERGTIETPAELGKRLEALI